MVKEKAITDKILNYLNSLDRCVAWKTHGGRFESMKGKPDITGVLEGRRFDFEVKAPGKNPTRLQKAQIRKLREAGSCAHTVYDINEVKHFINNMRTLGQDICGKRG